MKTNQTSETKQIFETNKTSETGEASESNQVFETGQTSVKSANINDKLGSMPIIKLLPRMALPMMMSFLIQALYNFVDSVFVARLSENALAAVSLAYPVQLVNQAISVGVGVGMCIVVAGAMGASDRQRANTMVNTGIAVLLIEVLLFVVLGSVFAEKFFMHQTYVSEIVEYGTPYLRICCIFSFGTIYAVYFEKALMSLGFSLYSMLAMAVGSVINIILDPILIFGLGPFPMLGTLGAAIATVVGQICEMSIALTCFLVKNDKVKLSLRGILNFRLGNARQILLVGFPTTIVMGLISVASFLVNQVLLMYSTTAAAAYGIWLKLHNFCHMPGYGLCNGFVPILSYNKGKGDIGRVKQTIRYSVIFEEGFMLVATIVLFFIPVSVLTLFKASPDMMEIGVIMLKICLVSLVFGGFSVIVDSIMQSLDGAEYSTIHSVLRGIVIPVALFYLLHYLSNDLNVVWWAVPVSDILSAVLGVCFYWKLRKKNGF